MYEDFIETVSSEDIVEETLSQEITETLEETEAVVETETQETETETQVTVTEVITYDYSEVLQEINEELLIVSQTHEAMLAEQQQTNAYLTYVSGFGLFAVVVILLLFSYKFIRIFI